MIKDFPEFGELELSDKNEIIKLTKDFLHYSNFSFSYLWAWDVASSKRGFARLNGNLIVKMFVYKTNELFFSVCGSHKIDETMQTLLDFIQKEHPHVQVRRLPEEMARQITLPGASIEEDRDNFDYIYSVEELKSLDGGKFKQKRNEVNALIAENPDIEARELDIKDPSVRKEISCLFYHWTKNKIAKESEFESNEKTAFNNMLILAETYDLMLTGVYSKNKMIAFLVSEVRNKDYALGHFSKTCPMKGANAYLLQSVAQMLSKRGIKYFNYEQDMGLTNLREAKMRFRPVSFLKKYSLFF